MRVSDPSLSLFVNQEDLNRFSLCKTNIQRQNKKHSPVQSAKPFPQKKKKTIHGFGSSLQHLYIFSKVSLSSNLDKPWIWSRKHFTTLQDPQWSVMSRGSIVSSRFIMPSLMSIAMDLYGPLNPPILWLNMAELTAKHFYFHYNSNKKKKKITSN